MHRRSLFLATCLVLILILGHVRTESVEIEWKNFAFGDLTQIYETSENYYLILFHNGTCTQECSKIQAILKNNADSFRSLVTGLKVHIASYKDDVTIADELGLEEDQGFGLFGISRGIPIRLDSYDANHDLIKAIKAFFSKQPIHLDTTASATKVTQHNKFIHFYYGAPSQSLNWAHFEVASRLAESPFYYSNFSEVSSLFGASRRRSFQTFDVANNQTIRMLDQVSYESIERFIETSTKPVPQLFRLESLRHSTSNMVPVIVYRATNATRNEYLRKLFSSALMGVVKNYYHVYELANSGSDEENTIAEFCTAENDTNKGEIVCIIQNYHGKLLRYILTEESEIKGVNTFISAYIDGKLTPYFRAETIDVKFNARVRNLNSYTWETFLAGYETDTTPRVLFYYKSDAPTATHKAFEAASLQVPESEAKFGRVNIDLNELTAEVQENAIYFEDSIYSGPIVAEDLAKWVKEKADAHLKESDKARTEDL
jgi:hypothetical protein